MPAPAPAPRAAIRFEAPLCAIDGSTILQLPAEASRRLPSRGQVAVAGTFNGHHFQAVLEPDGRRGHWMRVDVGLRQAAAVGDGATAALEIEPSTEWPEPVVPPDLEAALASASNRIQHLWREITPMARWEWVRWVNATRNPQTRQRRVEVTISKMEAGKRRPCCFDLAACTDADLSRSGRLRQPDEPVPG